LYKPPVFIKYQITKKTFANVLDLLKLKKPEKRKTCNFSLKAYVFSALITELCLMKKLTKRSR